MTNNQVLSALQLPHDFTDSTTRTDRLIADFAVVGHRGAMALAPENSAASFRMAEAAGVDEIELDVRITADGVPIVLHDPTLERLAAGGPCLATPVTQLTLAQLHEVLLDSGQPVPTFADILELTSVTLQVEIKDPSAVPALAALLGQAPSCTRRIKFSSFLPEALFLLALHLPAVPRGLIVSSFPSTRRQQEELEDVLITTGAGTLYTGFEHLMPVHVEQLHAAGLEVHVWPLTCPGDLDRALELRADGGTADNPASARAWLQSARIRAAAPAVEAS
ncbi:glycerophosphodiester phosphodiesterase [Arthrobacter sp. Alg241-R88]|uniref:glycerophosphodiester phosphodiesterase n=1 Tax=Arthrobacter sp. Alg241-R88 TaxID=2305984 RepID=UPI001966DD6E|nr:glycerophosphodiester phosphodiesterase [Arthrobacter sp. Alg241-R88]